VSDTSKKFASAMSPKLLNLQLKLIQKKYGALAAIYLRASHVSPMSRADLKKVEPVLIVLARWLSLTNAFSRKLEAVRRIVCRQYTGTYVSEWFYFALTLLGNYVLLIVSKLVLDGWNAFMVVSVIGASTVFFFDLVVRNSEQRALHLLGFFYLIPMLIVFVYFVD